MSAWRTDKPDADIEVLVRTSNPDMPLTMAVTDGEDWFENFSGCDITDIVTGWMHMEEAAAILDGKEGA